MAGVKNDKGDLDLSSNPSPKRVAEYNNDLNPMPKKFVSQSLEIKSLHNNGTNMCINHMASAVLHTPAPSKFCSNNIDAEVVNDLENIISINQRKERMKKRRSTLGGLTRGRSISHGLTVMTFKDKIAAVAENLPFTTIRSRLLDICLHEALNRIQSNNSVKLSEKFVNYLSENSESWAMETAFQTSSTNAGVDLRNKEGESGCGLSPVVELYKDEMKRLKMECDEWKAAMRTRKQDCLDARSALTEAKSGQIRIECQYDNLSKEQKNILCSKPNYSDYLKELQESEEKYYLTKLKIKNNFQFTEGYVSVVKMFNEANYNLMEKKTLPQQENVNVKELITDLIKFRPKLNEATR